MFGFQLGCGVAGGGGGGGGGVLGGDGLLDALGGGLPG